MVVLLSLSLSRRNRPKGTGKFRLEWHRLGYRLLIGYVNRYRCWVCCGVSFALTGREFLGQISRGIYRRSRIFVSCFVTIGLGFVTSVWRVGLCAFGISDEFRSKKSDCFSTFYIYII